MDYSSPYQFDQHWVQRVQKEEKIFQQQKDHFDAMKRENSYERVEKIPGMYDRMSRRSNRSTSSRSSNSVDTVSTYKNPKSSMGSSKSKSSNYTYLKEQLKQEQVIREKMQEEIEMLKKTISSLKR
ncbi:unnamed protein product [Moneuplotes crassus]|uniref:Uncharacterized protein n=1 Tax=Euplotes crassus TaxID=5936 RepID=A0AAD2D7H2_EUPCR|nr:unnamed protein product [Moneuplotes crassus]